MNEQKQRLTARRKLELYKETRAKEANLGEILRRYGVHTNDLRRIETLVEAAALEALKVRRNGQAPAGVSRDEYGAVVEELARKEQALTELTVEYALLKKSERSGSRGPSMGSTSRGSGAARSWPRWRTPWRPA